MNRLTLKKLVPKKPREAKAILQFSMLPISPVKTLKRIPRVMRVVNVNMTADALCLVTI